MSTVEDRLRDAYQGAAATVRPGTLRGAPAVGTQPARSRRRTAPGPSPASRRRRLLAPVAAAAAVTAIAVAAVVVPQLQAGRSPAPGAGPARPARFFIAYPGNGVLDVYSAVTGRLTGMVRSPQADTGLEVAAATGDDRSFIVAAESNAACGSTTLYGLRLTASGQRAGFTLLPVLRIAGSVTALASSADGQTIAYASAPCGRGAQSPGQIGVVHADGRPGRHWGWNPDPGQSVGSLSITADGKMIEYAASPNKIIGPDAGSVRPVREIRLLPAGAPPGTAAQRSRVAVTIRTAAPGSELTSALIAPGGQAVYFCTERGQSSPHPAETLRAYDVTSGTTSVLHSFGPTGRQGCLLGSSDGELLIVRDITRTPSLVDRLNLRTGRLTRVPVRQAVDEDNGSVPW
jgi:hypothetical protein